MWIWARETLPLICALRRGRCTATFWPTASHQHPQSAPYQNFLIILHCLQTCLIARNPQAWSGLKACRGCRDIALPELVPTSGRNRSPTGHTLPDPLPQIRLCSIKALCKRSFSPGEQQAGASLGKCHYPARMVQNGARLANGAHTAPPPCIFHTA